MTLRFPSKTAKQVLWLTPLRRWMLHRYPYNFTPEQLCFLVSCIIETNTVPGQIVEIGCAVGHTTVFLDKHLQNAGIRKEYVCIDTFGGFVDQDISWEVKSRGKPSQVLRDAFSVNTLHWFRYTMKLNGCADVKAVATNVKNYSFQEPISFCLCDVDLYKPTSYSLRNVWSVLSPGGVIVVDDCKDGNIWDGAYEAYREFIGEPRMNLEARIMYDKLGVIRKI